jgi:lysine biosynthesis protein LysW
MNNDNRRNKKGIVFEATCPACGARIHLRKMPRKDHFITCQNCDSMLVVTRLAPLKLEWAFEEPFDDFHQPDLSYIEDLQGLDEGWYSQSDISVEGDHEEYQSG